MLDTLDTSTTVFAKTALGQQEILDRSLNLAPLVRRTLVLVDGKRSGAELAVFLVGKGDIEAVLAQLLDAGCVEAVKRTRSVPAAVATPLAAPAETPAENARPALDGLPPSASRSASDNEMARNFMINTVNSIIGQYSRLSLVEKVARAQGTEALRAAYADWESTMSDHTMAARRLPELREKLFRVL